MQDGKCLRMVGVFQDITERKKSAEKIAKLHSLLTSAKAVDEILLRARSEHELFQETCDSLLK